MRLTATAAASTTGVVMETVLFEGSSLQKYLAEEGIEHECVESLSADLDLGFDPTTAPDTVHGSLSANELSGGGHGLDGNSGNGNATATESSETKKGPPGTHELAFARVHDAIVATLTEKRSFLAALADDFAPILMRGADGATEQQNGVDNVASSCTGTGTGTGTETETATDTKVCTQSCVYHVFSFRKH